MMLMNRNLLIYIICSNKEEALKVHSNLNRIRIPNNSKLMVIDNSETEILKEIKSVKLTKKESLNKIICDYIVTQNYSHFCRLDPDDIDENCRMLETVEVGDIDYIIPKYKIILDNDAHELNTINGLCSQYEILGAGVIISKRVLKNCIKDLKNNRGQDNYIAWLEMYREHYSREFRDYFYYYKLDAENKSRSSQSKRILRERKCIIDRRLNEIKRSWFAIVRFRGPGRNSWIKYDNNEDCASLLIKFLGFGVYIFIRKHRTIRVGFRYREIEYLGEKKNTNSESIEYSIKLTLLTGITKIKVVNLIEHLSHIWNILKKKSGILRVL